MTPKTPGNSMMGGTREPERASGATRLEPKRQIRRARSHRSCVYILSVVEVELIESLDRVAAHPLRARRSLTPQA
jgi:hypothetical protein